MTPFALETLIQDVLDGEASEEQRAELEREMAQNPDSRRIYLEHIYLGMALEFAQAELYPASAKNVIPMEQVIERQKRQTLRIATYVAVAVALIGLAAMVHVILPQPPLARFNTAPATQFTLTHSMPDGKRPPEGRALAADSRVSLTSGMLELEFASGVKGIVRAPADFVLRGESLIDLHSGTAWFEITRDTAGFQVKTRDFLLTDLGTEFGIVSKADNPDEVHVFSGHVSVTNHHGSGSTTDVTTGQARAAQETGDWADVDFHSDHFFEKLPSENLLPKHRHWDFETNGTGELALHPAMAGEGPARVDGRVGKAVSFDAVGDGLVSEWLGIGGNRPRTVAFWLKLPVDTPHYDETLVSWGRRSSSQSSNGEWSVRATNYDWQDPMAVRKNWTDKTRLQLYLGNGWAIGTTELKRGVWHHIAVTYGHGTDLYVDGRLDPSRFRSLPGDSGKAIDTNIRSSDSAPLSIGQSRSIPSNSCDAVIDELYIFETELSRDSIRILANP